MRISAEYPKLDQKYEAQGYHNDAGIKQEYELVPGVKLFESFSHVGTPPKIRNPAALGRAFVYLTDHDKRNRICKNRGCCAGANSRNEGPRNHH
jgi:hypothetical protein